MTFPGLGGDSDLGALFAQVQQLQGDLEKMNASTAATEVEGTAGGGAVSVRVSGEFEFSSIHIDPSVIDPDAGDFLEDLVLAALRDAVHQLQAMRAAAVNAAMSSAMANLLDPTAGATGEPTEETDDDSADR